MHLEHRYEEAVRCLAEHGYTVSSAGQGYLVISRTDPDDISVARHLDDLVDLAELAEWQALHIVQLQHAR
jgi:hypothetical protein